MLSLRFFAPLVAGAFLLGGCAGGSSTAIPAGAATTASSSSAASSAAVVTVPTVGALSAGAVTLPTVTSGAGTTLSVKTSIGSNAVQNLTRRDADSITNSTAFAQVTITAGSDVTFTGSFTATITYVGGPATYFGTFQDQNGALSSTPQASPVGTTYSLTSPTGTYHVAAGQSVSFSFSAAKTGDAPVTSVAAAAGPLVFGSTSLSFLATGSGAAKTDTVTETAYSGTFTVTSENAAVATATVSGGTITVTPVGPGSTSIDVTGGATGKISVTVTTSPVSVQ